MKSNNSLSGRTDASASVRISSELKRRVEEHSQNEGVSIRHVLDHAVQQYVGDKLYLGNK